MKKTAAIALTFGLIACLFAGCRRNVTPETSTPTTETTRPATQPATEATTPHTTAPTATEGTSGTDGMLEDGMIDGTGDAGRGRRATRIP